MKARSSTTVHQPPGKLAMIGAVLAAVAECFPRIGGDVRHIIVLATLSH